jgi:hypothetical protein
MQRDNEEADGVERRFGAVEKRLGGVEVRVGALEKRVDEGFKEVRGDIAKLDEKFDVKFDRLQTVLLQAVLGLAMSLLIVVTGILLTGSPG